MRYPCAYSFVIFMELAALLPHASLESGPMFRERCPRPHLKNGWVKLRSRGRIAKFNCIREFQLLGEKFATCLGGEWDNPPPLCVRPGCEVLSLSNGQMMQTYRGAVVTFFCNPGYRLQGSAKLYCDGKSWNGTAPQCTAISDNPALSCDFESEDLCGWSQDPHHHFNWTRLNHNTPSGSVGTGPSYDHTFGKGNDGYYLYIETSGPRKANDTARLYSPVYGTEVLASQPSCFIFWYHMYGATVGTLAVYIKPDNLELTSDLEAGFFQSGNKGDVWLNGVVNIPAIGVPFQIIIEGVRGPGYVGDTAIDDVRLANGSDCEQPTTVGSRYIASSTQDDGQSCRLRCVRDSTPATAEQVTVTPSCDCHSFCSLSNTCCEDYSLYCVNSAVTRDAVTMRSTRPSRTFPTPPPLPPLEPHPLETFTTTPQTVTTRESVFRPIPIPPDPTPLIIYLPTRPATTSTRQTTVAPTTMKPTTTTTTTTTVKPTIKTTAKQPTIVTTLGTIIKPTLAQTTAKRTTTTKRTIITTAGVTAERITTTKQPTVMAAKATTVKPTFAQSTMKRTTPTTVKRTTVSSTTKARPPFRTTSTSRSTTRSTTTSTRRSTTPARVSTSRSTTIKTKSSSWRNVFVPSTMSSFVDDDLHGKEWQAAPKEPLMQSEESAVPISLIAGVAVLVAAVAVISIVASILIRQRRKSRSQQHLAEDSDVRFLTVDEILDFTLAQPKQEDEEYDNY